jgi:prolyl oligopeptidase
MLLAGWTRHAIGEVTVHDLVDGRRRGHVDLPGLGTVSGLGERPEGGSESWFTYTDFLTPPTAYHYDARTEVVDVWAHPPGSVDVPAVHARQVVYRSADDTPVRLTLLSREREPTEEKPTILYGYGGFGQPMTPAYAPTALAWVEAGGVYAIAHLRGGSEEGEDWHRAGMRERKQNVFDDFHAAAEWLIEQGWTSPRQLGISGGSNGGLLVGAALTQRPELYAAVTCAAPLLDMVRYEGFGLGTTWNDEYGTAANATEFGWLISYSPYHRVVDGVDYPAVLFTVFDSDTRVDPMHARKMCAALQHATVSDRPVLIRTERDVGHGARAVSRMVELSVDSLSFLAAQTGLTFPDS